MLTAVFTSAVSFVSTNMDDIFLLMLLFAGAAGRRERAGIAAGQLLGIGTLTAVSLLGAFALRNIPPWCIGLLGFVPIALGVRAWIAGRRGSEEEEAAPAAGVGSVMLLAIANGADNVGVYIPLFAGYTAAQTAAAAGVFFVLTLLWCFLGDRLASLPALRGAIRRYQRILVPAVLIGLGLWILAENLLLK